MKNFLLAAAAFTAISSPAFAADLDAVPVQDKYLTIFGAWAFDGNHDFDFVNDVTAARFGYNVSMEDGFIGGGALGWVMNPNVRVEAEFAVGQQDFGDDYASAVFPVALGESGGVTSFTLLGNVWLNADLGGFQPYVGGGVGGGIYKGDLSITNGSGNQFSSTEFAPAYQLGAGVRYMLASGMELDLSYRYRGALVQFDSDIAGFSTDDGNLDSQSVQLGLTFRF